MSDATEMRLLTLTQPWATLVALGAKRIETRPWHTSFRGLIAIHAGKGLGPVGGRRGLRSLVGTDHFFGALVDDFDHRADVSLVDRIVDCLPRGAIVAVATLADVRKIWPEISEYGAHMPEYDQIWPLTDQERAFGDYSPGRFAWLLADVRPLREPLAYRGAQGLRRLPPEAVAAVEERL